jgi:KDO2-lipid IV(A) lauroyltransferase
MSLPVRARQLLEYVVVRAGLTAALSLGFAGAMRLARRLADLAFRWDRRHRRRALSNLESSLPELTKEERERIARGSFRSFAQCYVELVYEARIVNAGNLASHFEFDAHPAARAALDRGRGAVFVTAHVGNWEITGSLIAYRGIPLVSVARPIDNPWVNRFLLSTRERTGQRIVAKQGALRELGKALRQGGYLGIIADQNAGRHGIFVEFFGRPASTVAAPAILALKYDAPLIPGRPQRLGEDFRHRLFLERPVEPPETGDRSRDVRIMIQEMTSRFESWVREAPDQWLWAHRRWKKRPKEGEEWRLSPSTSAG